MPWWENFDFGKLFEEAGGLAGQVPQAIGGFLPSGDLPPTWAQNLPVVGGIQKAWEEAQRPTGEEHISRLIRDIPVVGGLERGFLEFPLNIFQQYYETVPQVIAGGLHPTVSLEPWPAQLIRSVATGTAPLPWIPRLPLTAKALVQAATPGAEGFELKEARRTWAEMPWHEQLGAGIFLDPLTYSPAIIGHISKGKALGQFGKLISTSRALEKQGVLGVSTKTISDMALQAHNISTREAWKLLTAAKGLMPETRTEAQILTEIKNMAQPPTMIAKARSMLELWRPTHEAMRTAFAEETGHLLATLTQEKTTGESIALIKLFVENPEALPETVRALAHTRMATIPRLVLKELLRAEEGAKEAYDFTKLGSLFRESETPEKALVAMVNVLEQGLEKLIPPTKYNPLQRLQMAFNRFASEFLYMGWNPGYAVQNLGSNVLPMAADGTLGFRGSKSIDAFFARYPLEPRAAAGMGAASFLGGEKFRWSWRGPFLRLAQEFERLCSRNTWATVAQRQHWGLWRIAMPTMPEYLISKLEPHLQEALISQLRQAETVGDLARAVKALEGQAGTVYLRTVLPENIASDLRQVAPELLEEIRAMLLRTVQGSDEARKLGLLSKEAWIRELDKLRSIKRAEVIAKARGALNDIVDHRTAEAIAQATADIQEAGLAGTSVGQKIGQLTKLLAPLTREQREGLIAARRISRLRGDKLGEALDAADALERAYLNAKFWLLGIGDELEVALRAEVHPFIQDMLREIAPNPLKLQKGSPARAEAWLKYFELEIKYLERLPREQAKFFKPPPKGKRVAPIGRVINIAQDAPATPATMAQGAREAILQAFEDALKKVEDYVLPNWDNVSGGLSAEALMDINKWIDGPVTGELHKVQLVAGKVATAMRDFALHNYTARYNFDTLLSYLMPYHFWYTRTYARWAERVAQNPAILASYVKLQGVLDEINKDLPPSWKNQVQFELFGNPYMVNLRAFADPFYGITNTYFDRAKEKTPEGKFVAALQEFGPSLWAPFLIAFAKTQPEPEAWINYQTAITRPIKGATALLRERGFGADIIPPGGINIEAGARKAFGLPEYEKYDPSRVGKMIYFMMERGIDNPETGRPVTEMEAKRAMFIRKGPLWDAAMQAVGVQQAGPALTSWATRMALREKNIEELELSAIRSRYYQIGQMPEGKERTAAFKQFFKEYPWYTGLQTTYKSEEEAAKAWEKQQAYDILNSTRLPPGWKSRLPKEDQKLVDRFYEVKGDLAGLTTTERKRLDALVAVLEEKYPAPSEEEAARRAEASAQIVEYFNIKETQGQAAARAYWNAHPLLAQYYSRGQRAVTGVTPAIGMGMTAEGYARLPYTPRPAPAGYRYVKGGFLEPIRTYGGYRPRGRAARPPQRPKIKGWEI